MYKLYQAAAAETGRSRGQISNSRFFTGLRWFPFLSFLFKYKYEFFLFFFFKWGNWRGRWCKCVAQVWVERVVRVGGESLRPGPVSLFGDWSWELFFAANCDAAWTMNIHSPWAFRPRLMRLEVEEESSTFFYHNTPPPHPSHTHTDRRTLWGALEQEPKFISQPEKKMKKKSYLNSLRFKCFKKKKLKTLYLKSIPRWCCDCESV